MNAEVVDQQDNASELLFQIGRSRRHTGRRVASAGGTRHSVIKGQSGVACGVQVDLHCHTLAIATVFYRKPKFSVERGRDGYAAYLCENLGADEEKIIETDVKGLLDIDAAPLNVLILIKQYETGGDHYVPTLGIPDDQFATVKKLITKEEVRVVTLSKLKLRHDMTLWDIGAGSGSVSIEADHLLPNGRILAVERNEECRVFIKENLKKFNARNVTLVEGVAPDCLDELPDPDRVFIGGSGGRLWDILQIVDKRLPASGRIVLNAITLDTLTSALEFFNNAGYEVEVTTVNIARTRPLTDYKMFEAFNPVFVMAAVKI